MKVKKSESLFTTDELNSFGVSIGNQVGRASTSWKVPEPLHSIQRKFDGIDSDNLESVLEASGKPLSDEIYTIERWRETLTNFLPHSQGLSILNKYHNFLVEKRTHNYYLKTLQELKADLDKVETANAEINAEAKPAAKWDNLTHAYWFYLFAHEEHRNIPHQYEKKYRKFGCGHRIFIETVAKLKPEGDRYFNNKSERILQNWLKRIESIKTVLDVGIFIDGSVLNLQEIEKNALIVQLNKTVKYINLRIESRTL